MSCAIGIDIGGTKTAIGIVDVAIGRIIQKHVLNSPLGSGLDQAFLGQIADAVGRMERLPIGIGICELVDTSGNIASQRKFFWSSADVRRAFDFAPSVEIESDVRAAAIAEGRFGAGVGLDHWINVNAGTVIATVLMQRDKPYVGACGLGMAFGMSPTSLDSNKTQPTIEDLAGARGMLKIARASKLEAETLQDLIIAAPRILEAGGQVLGRAIAMLANMLDPQTIVLGGGVGLSSSAFCSAFKRAFHSTVWFGELCEPEIVTAKLNVDSGLIGAALVGAGSR